MTTLDHIGFQVNDFARSFAFYEAALAPLGIDVAMRLPAELDYQGAGFGVDGKAAFWIISGAKVEPHVHVAFAAKRRADVDAFYKAAIAAGGTDNGPPGIRMHYHPNYYAAFVLDPDGHNIEACCHHPE